MERFARKKEILEKAKAAAAEKFGEDFEHLTQVGKVFDGLFKQIIRNSILQNERRIAGRKLDEIRPVETAVGILPRVHGSAIFQRGETQGLSAVTLSGPGSQLLTEGIEGEAKHRFFHHYTFPPFSVGECSNRLFTGNREIGHGALAQRALEAVLPEKDEFGYTIAANTEILQSNGSSSMAATCGTTMALMDAGVPIKAPVSGIAMGLMTDESGNFKILSDIQDEEDSGGDMDFKVAGTAKGITAIQMDIKVTGISQEIFAKAFEQAKKGRAEILQKMLQTLPETRADLSPFAPRLITLKINPEKIRDVIGKGGEVINKIIDETGCEIDIEQDGTIVISATSGESGEQARQWIEEIVREVEVGQVFTGTVVRIENYGAFVDIGGGKQGLLHVSNIADTFIKDVSTVLKMDQKVKVKVSEIDSAGKFKVSMKGVSQDN